MQSTNFGHLTVAELQVAEREIFKRVEQVAFPEVIDVLSATKCCEDKKYPKKVLKKVGASIRQLTILTLLRVRGRLVNAPIGDERKHPIILPYKHHVTDLIIKQCHENLGHMGQESVLSYGARICLVILERGGLDCEGEIGGVACFRKMQDLSTAEKCVPWEPVHGRFTRSETCT